MAVDIKGIADLSRTFKGLSLDLQKKTAPRMVAAAGGIIRKKAKSNAQAQGLRKTGALINNIAVKREKNAKPGTVEYHVGVRHGRALGNGKKVVKYLAVTKHGRIVTKRQNDPFYWRFLEFGTKHIRATHFIGSAFDSTHSQVIAAMEGALKKAIDRAGK